VNVTTTVEGRERYPIQVRYQRGLREDVEQLGRAPVVTPSGEVVPLETLAAMETSWGPGMINSENARLVAHVSFSPSGRTGDLETVEAVMGALRRAQKDGSLKLPAGYELQPVGSFENQIEANRRLMWVIPLVMLINAFIIYLQFRDLPLTLILFSGIPVSAAGGMILLALAGVELNTAVWVGFIALFGIAVDDGVVIATYMDQIFRARGPQTIAGIREATVEAGLKRIRPCLMTICTTVAALLPVIFATGRGADVARSMALPVFGGLTLDFTSLFIVPVLFCGYKELRLRLGLDAPFQVEREEREAELVAG
jgi:Cu(I)/Ag(I) efflux system membrane protein CusA/SilA